LEISWFENDPFLTLNYIWKSSKNGHL